MSVPHSFKVSEKHADSFPNERFIHSATLIYRTTCTPISKTTEFLCQTCETLYVNRVFRNETKEERRQITNNRYIFVMTYRNGINNYN